MSGEPPHSYSPGWFTALGATITGLLGMLGLWLAQRLIGKAAVKTAMDAGWERLINQLQEEREHWMQLAEKGRRDLETLTVKFDAETLKFEAERATLQGEVRNLMQLVESMKSILRAHGIAVPDHRPRYSVENPPPKMLELPPQGGEDR